MPIKKSARQVGVYEVFEADTGMSLGIYEVVDAMTAIAEMAKEAGHKTLEDAANFFSISVDQYVSMFKVARQGWETMSAEDLERVTRNNAEYNRKCDEARGMSLDAWLKSFEKE